jgi:hypothetical protein
MPFFRLIGREKSERLGSNLLSYYCQIIFAHFMNYYIVYDTVNFEDSIFIKSMCEYIDYYNQSKVNDNVEINIREFTNNKESSVDNCFFFYGFVTSFIKMDIYTYFHLNIEKDFTFRIYEKAESLFGNELPFDPKNAILVHMRLDDLSQNNSYDYDGNLVSKYFIEKVDSGYFCDYKNFKKTTIVSEYYKYITKCGITKTILNGKIKKLPRDYYKLMVFQSIIEEEKITKIIDKLSEKYPKDEIITVSSRTGINNLSYKTIRSENPDFDLYCLCKCEKVILSRSTYSLICPFFSKKTDVIIPSWSISACMGLQTIYDKTNFQYFG